MEMTFREEILNCPPLKKYPPKALRLGDKSGQSLAMKLNVMKVERP